MLNLIPIERTNFPSAIVSASDRLLLVRDCETRRWMLRTDRWELIGQLPDDFAPIDLAAIGRAAWVDGSLFYEVGNAELY